VEESIGGWACGEERSVYYAGAELFEKASIGPLHRETAVAEFLVTLEN